MRTVAKPIALWWGPSAVRHDFVRAFGSSTTHASSRIEPSVCVACGKRAIYKWNDKGYCSAHRSHAEVVMRAEVAASGRISKHTVCSLRVAGERAYQVGKARRVVR